MGPVMLHGSISVRFAGRRGSGIAVDRDRDGRSGPKEALEDEMKAMAPGAQATGP